MIQDYLENLIRSGHVPKQTFREEKIERKVSIFYEEKQLDSELVTVATKIDERNQTLEINIDNIFKVDEEAEFFEANYDRYDVLNRVNNIGAAFGKMYEDKGDIHLRYTIPYGVYDTFDPSAIEAWQTAALTYRNAAIRYLKLSTQDEYNVLIPN